MSREAMPDTERVDSAADNTTRHPSGVIATIVGLLILVFVVWGLAAASVLVGMVSDPCASRAYECNYERIWAGQDIAEYGVIVVGVIAIIASFVNLRARRSAWWIPPLALVLAVGVSLGGFEFARSGVESGLGPDWSPSDRPAQL
jgi:uncharacterized membrane protein HdeD (DUF308 family)